MKTPAEIYAKAERMEKQNRTYEKGNTLIWKGTLEQLRKAVKEQRTLNFDYSNLCGGYDHEGDCKGYCML